MKSGALGLRRLDFAGVLRRRGLQCKDDGCQLVTARLVCAVAQRLDDEALLACLGMMLEVGTLNWNMILYT